MAETNQPTSEPSEGIDTSPTVFRPCILHTHEQHAADCIRIMVKSGMSLPLGEDQSAPLIVEVWSLFSSYAIPIPSSILFLILLVIVIYSLLTITVFNQALQKIRLASHICRLAELLHANAMQQLELALLGSPAAKVLDVLAMATQSHTSACPSSMPLHLATASSVPVSAPSVPIIEVTETVETMEVKASTSKMSPLTTSADIEIAPCKCHRIIAMLIPATTSRTSSSPSKLPLVVLSELSVPVHTLPEWINHPGGHKDYKCELFDFQHTNIDCMLTHIWQHLEISIGCPMCGKGFQNVASLHKHGRKIHSIHIVETENE